MRVVIGEDEALTREGLLLVLEHGGIDVVAAAVDAPGLVAAVEHHRPDLVITDIRMPPSDVAGLEAALALRHRHEGLAVLVLSQHVQRQYARQLVDERAGGLGYLLKQRVADIDGFRRDVRRVAEGATVLDREVVAAMLARASRDEGLGRLTARQLEVLGLVAEGRSNAAIARHLSITEKTVVQHTSQIYDQLGLTSSLDDHRRVLAVVRYLDR